MSNLEDIDFNCEDDDTEELKPGDELLFKIAEADEENNLVTLEEVEARATTPDVREDQQETIVSYLSIISTQAQTILTMKIKMEAMENTISVLEGCRQQEINSWFNPGLAGQPDHLDGQPHQLLPGPGPADQPEGTLLECPPSGGLILHDETPTNSLSLCEPTSEDQATEPDPPAPIDEVENLPQLDTLGQHQEGATNDVMSVPSLEAGQVPPRKKDNGEAFIQRLVKSVDDLAKKYSLPVHKRKDRKVRTTKRRPQIVPKYLGSLWSNLLDFTPLEPIYVPDSRPRVNWSKLNTNMHKNLPKAKNYPIYGASQDPAYYTRKCQYVNQLVFESCFPFGCRTGFLTSRGIIAPPEDPVHGYKWSEEDGDWVIAACGG